MANIYDAMVAALRDHWKAHSNAYPQRFELTQDAFNTLNETRKTVITTMNYAFRPGWENDFLGVPVSVADGGNCMVDKDGNQVPLAL
ncbi:hypothetical protein [Comamonas terrigena]|uniref:hypothetical protein n=1 Tax=Comamonas terrigena TaxID=32013 RepID=UPI0028AB1DD0|nr:hypothetical protein [Comamonas terrigena]